VLHKVPKKVVSFLGVLGNVDASILNVKFDHGFYCLGMPDDEARKIISSFEDITIREAATTLFMELPTTNIEERKVYFVRNSFQCDLEENVRSEILELWPCIARFDNELVHRYLNRVLRLMRLFKEGNVCMPLTYYILDADTSNPRAFIRGRTYRSLTREPYTVDSSEFPDLQTFIMQTKLPFAHSFLDLAFENFELSYEVPNRNLAFLALMVSMETLLNRSNLELRHTLSRNVAALLGKEKQDSALIMSDMRKLYDKRSKLVHSGSSDISQEDALRLRYLARESIKEILRLGKAKGELLDMLDSSGFGERSWR
jgi:hypothetical protein